MKKNEEVLDSIEQRIHLVRGVYVIVDRDLASLYGVENRVLKQAVRRNLEKFPDDFMFQLSDSEAKELISRWVSQSVIPIGFNTGGARIFAPRTSSMVYPEAISLRIRRK